jgi:hypothetical protein
MTSQGHPYTIFRRALGRGNLMGAEATVKELPLGLGLADALANYAAAKGAGATMRWEPL